MLSLEYFQVRFGDATTVNRSYEWEDIHPIPGEAPREQSREEHREGNKGNKRRSKRKWRIYQRGYRGELVTRCGRKTWTICVVHIHNDVKWGKMCAELISMFLTCLALQVGIVCGDGNQA